eukprot:TRINITY_DN11890_c0_g1_i1.p1 TRINITY_DN11890_c0_g1~~TRINITY_DN11890_c0_g1_i1.p1  ORF type:complete len:159 (+),score=22.08 TRINITY_DN11890_c0_g1_i1:59-535(+)
MRFYAEDAPKSVACIKNQVRQNIYEEYGNFYRAEKDFVLQGGVWPNLSPEPYVPLEYKLPNEKYAVSLARAQEPDTGSSEFAIMLANNTYWNGPFHDDALGYAVFAQVIEGWDVVERIMLLPTKVEGLTMLVNPVKWFNITLQDEYQVLKEKVLESSN